MLQIISLESGKNTRLKSISASGHSIPNEALEELGSAIASLNHGGITCVVIGDQHMGDDGVISLCKHLKDVHGSTLETVDFSFKTLSKVGAEIIGHTFGASINLRDLVLSRNPDIGDDGLDALCRAANAISPHPFPKLQKLDLSECNIGLKGLESLVDCLMINDIVDITKNMLIDLNINSNPLGYDACNPIANLIVGPSPDMNILQSISMKNCSIGDKGLEIIANSFLKKNCGYLKKVDVSNNSIGAKGIKSLALAIVEGKDNIHELQELILADNQIGEDGIVALANALATQETNIDANATITILDLTNTNCGTGGADALMKCSSLSSLRLFNNNLGTTGIITISDHLIGGHPNLEHLDLGGNRANGAAVSKLLSCLLKDEESFKNKLKVLELGGNENNDESMFEKVRDKRRELDIPLVKETSKDDIVDSS